MGYLNESTVDKKSSLFKTIRNTQTAQLNSKDVQTGRKQGVLKYMSLNLF
jgi:hypothetical protein